MLSICADGTVVAGRFGCLNFHILTGRRVTELLTRAGVFRPTAHVLRQEQSSWDNVLARLGESVKVFLSCNVGGHKYSRHIHMNFFIYTV